MQSTKGFQMSMSVRDLLRKKRDGEELTKDDIEAFILNLVTGKVADSQIGAMLMAIYIRGLSDAEAAHLTRSMVLSGHQLVWPPEWQGLLVDKHSTGGVGDKISLILAPILAACGLKVPMVSGRSLAHTGGTLDKLESIPGFKVDLDEDTMVKALEQVGCFIAAATSTLCPADKILYPTRDLTVTVDYLNLIVSSIISKKVALGTKFLVIDVKVGRAAFCKTVEAARALAKQLISVSAQLGVRTKVVLSRMDEPLGSAVGNALEVAETLQALAGTMSPPVARLISLLGSSLLEMTNYDGDPEKLIRTVIEDGSAMEKFRQMLLVQGVGEETVANLIQGRPVLPTSEYTKEIKAVTPGWVSEVDALLVGQICQGVDSVVGVVVGKHVGDVVVAGDTLMTVHHSHPTLLPDTIQLLQGAFTIVSTQVVAKDVVIDVL